MPTRPNGGFIGTENVTDNASASGIYTLNEARELTEAGDFPSARYVPSKSVRFDRAASAYLYRTFGTPTTGTKWTYSLWIKKSQDPSTLGYATGHLLTTAGAGAQGFIGFGNNIEGEIVFGYSGYGRRNTNYTVFRDPSAWYHIVVAVDTTQTNETDRALLFVNGKLFPWSTSTAIGQNDTTQLNQAVQHNIGRQTGQPYQSFEGYMSDINFIDGQQLNCTDFGQRDAKTGMWLPKRYGGSYGNNGFFLSFANNTSTTTLGYDDGTGAIGSGAGSNDWTPSGFSVAADENGDSFVDVPGIGSTVSVDTGGVVRGNYATLNPLTAWRTVKSSNGNLSASGSSSFFATGTMALPSGKWYCEVKILGGTNEHNIGFVNLNSALLSSFPSTSTIRGSNAFSLYSFDGKFYDNGTASASLATFATNDIVMFAYDADNSKIYVGRNGTWLNSAVPASGTGAVSTSATAPLIVAAQYDYGNATGQEWNFGQRQFAYTPPAGFKSLCAPNLPDPEIIFPWEHFDIKTYTGRGTAVAIGNTARETDNYQLPTSLRFDGSAYLQRNPTYTGSKTRWTWSGWVKRSKATTSNTLFGSYVDSNNFNIILLRETGDDGTLTLFNYSGGYDYQVRTKNVFIDDAEWYHIVVAYDSTNSAASDRIKIYVNGVLVEKTINNAVSANFEGDINNTYAHFIGNDGSNARYHEGYMSNVHFIDGSALTPDLFGTFDVDGSWQAKEYTKEITVVPSSSYVGYFDGSGDYLTTASNSVFDFGTGSFTIECWFKKLGAGGSSDGTGNAIIMLGNGTQNSAWLGITDAGVLTGRIGFNSSWATDISGGSVSNGTWNHAALVRTGTTVNLHLNGVVVATGTNSTNLSTYGTTASIANNIGGSRTFNGYIAEARIVNGTAVYTTGFAPPTTSLTAISGTSLLTCQDSTFIDNSSNGITITPSGNSTVVGYTKGYGINGFNILNTVEDTEAAPTWNYNPMANFKTAASFVNNQTYIYLTGAGYDGGYKGSTVSLGSFKALQNSWNMDYIANRNGVNSSPFPNYVIGLGRANTASSYSSGPTQSIWNMYISNNYNFDLYVQNGNGTTLGSFNQGSSSWAYAGTAFRVSFDVSTYTYTFYGNTSGLFTGMTQIYTYTLTAAQKAAIQTYINSDFYIFGTYRANDDGWRNIRWYTV